MHKQTGEKILDISILSNYDNIQIRIEDNGIGRKKSELFEERRY